VDPETEAALVEAAPTQEEIAARREAAIARRANAERLYRTRLRDDLVVNIRDNEVDEKLVDLSEEAMQRRVDGLRELAAAGYSINEIEREVLVSGKTRVTAPDGKGGRKLVAIESPDGRLRMLDSITAEYADLLA
jgi:hypothetical protein